MHCVAASVLFLLTIVYSIISLLVFINLLNTFFIDKAILRVIGSLGGGEKLSKSFQQAFRQLSRSFQKAFNQLSN